jgi:hypothetical protein
LGTVGLSADHHEDDLSFLDRSARFPFPILLGRSFVKGMINDIERGVLMLRLPKDEVLERPIIVEVEAHEHTRLAHLLILQKSFDGMPDSATQYETAEPGNDRIANKRTDTDRQRATSGAFRTMDCASVSAGQSSIETVPTRLGIGSAASHQCSFKRLHRRPGKIEVID